MYRPFSDPRTGIRPASLAKRLLAMVYDILIIVAIWIFVAAMGVMLNNGQAVEGPALKSALFLITFGFFGFFWTRSGQTLGMTAWRLRIETPEGGRISWTQALMRFMFAIPSLGLALLGLIMVQFSDERLAMHDRLSGTRMVELEKADHSQKKRKKAT